jgi:integrase
MKIRVGQADQGAWLALQASWTKGGRARQIPIRTAAQRKLLERIKAFLPTKESSLIPAHLSYVQHLRRYESLTVRAGFHKLHGLRHAYAQERFYELAGFASPAAGGPPREALTAQQREADYEARMLISEELGHGREAITAVYLGR